MLVTGGARRIGRAIALDLAAHGCDVAVHYRRSRDEAQQTRRPSCARSARRPQAFAADLADEAQCRALVPAVRRSASAGSTRWSTTRRCSSTTTSASFSYAAMERHWRANTAPAVCSRARCTRTCRRGAAGSGCVVNLLDQKLWNPNPDYFSYTLSKAALEAATTLLAQALAPRVRVCGVAPGVTLPSGPMSDGEFARARSA